MIHYVSQYSESEDYVFSPGGTSKMSYFLYCLKQFNLAAKIFSCVPLKSNGFVLPKNTVSKYGYNLHYVASIKSSFKLGGILNILLIQFQLFLYLLKLPNKDTVYVYHERFYAPVLKLIRKIKRFRLVCDVEEIYTIAAQYSQKEINKEIEYLKGFDYYTVAGQGLAEILSLKPNQYAVCCGVYSPIINSEERDSKTIKILYAGTFDTIKGGALAAIESVRYLGPDYRLLVCGFGNDEQISEIKKRITDMNNEKGAEAIVYLGYISNRSQEYINILNDCKIGMSTQNPAGAFNNTSFPSKIFEYMRHGLSVVSTANNETSNLPVSHCIFFIEDYSPIGVAKTIERAAKSSDIQIQSKILKKMHCDFCVKFKMLLTNNLY